MIYFFFPHLQNFICAHSNHFYPSHRKWSLLIEVSNSMFIFNLYLTSSLPIIPCLSASPSWLPLALKLLMCSSIFHLKIKIPYICYICLLFLIKPGSIFMALILSSPLHWNLLISVFLILSHWNSYKMVDSSSFTTRSNEHVSNLYFTWLFLLVIDTSLLTTSWDSISLTLSLLVLFLLFWFLLLCLLHGFLLSSP